MFKFDNNTTVSLNKNDLDRLIMCLSMYLEDNCSAAKIQSFIIDYFGLSFDDAPSTAYIDEVINDDKHDEVIKNTLDELDKKVCPTVTTVCGDELCSPTPHIIYTSTIPHTGYCLNLNIFNDHQRGRGAVWKECYQPLINAGLNPNITLCDQSAGTMSGHNKTFKNAYNFADFFHLRFNFSELVDKAKKDIENLEKTKIKIMEKRQEIECTDDQVCLFNAPDLLIHQTEVQENIKDMHKAHENLKTLYSWFVGYIITLAGDSIPDRLEIYEFIAEEVQNCAILGLESKASNLAETMIRQEEKLLYFLKFLDDKFENIADENKELINKEQLWRINKYLHYNPQNPKAIELALQIIDEVGHDTFDHAVNTIKKIHDTTETCSSYVENNIGRIKPIIKRHKNYTQAHMNKIRLFISCSNLHSSRDYSKRSQTPLQLTLGAEHDKHWIDYLYAKPTIKQQGIRLEKLDDYRKWLNAA